MNRNKPDIRRNKLLLEIFSEIQFCIEMDGIKVDTLFDDFSTEEDEMT